MDEFEIVVDIDRPVRDVFAALVNFDRVPDWNSGVTEVKKANDDPLEVGSTVVYFGRFLGRSFESPSECTEYIREKKFSAKSTSGPFHLEIENTLEPVEGGTRMTSTFRGESRGFFKLAEPVVIRLAKHHFESSTENFKALLEAGAL